MNTSPSRLRMIAGPNGSGKTTLKQLVQRELSGRVLGVDLNPDEVERILRDTSTLSLADYGVSTPDEQPVEFFAGSEFLISKGLAHEARNVRCKDGVLNFERVEVNSYFASVAVAFIRERLLESRASFVIETVMSSHDKVSILDPGPLDSARTSTTWQRKTRC